MGIMGASFFQFDIMVVFNICGVISKGVPQGLVLGCMLFILLNYAV